MKRSPDGLRIKKICPVCKNEFFVHPYRAEKAKFCSYSCRAKGVPVSEITKKKRSKIAKLMWKMGVLKPAKGGISTKKGYAISKALAWNKKHSDRHKKFRLISVRKGRAKKFGQTIHHTFNEWDNLKKKYNYKCVCCGRHEPEIKLEADHIIPLSKGGDNTIKNIQPLCRSCNARKNDNFINYLKIYERVY